jgi:DNA-binding NarL/FixJ family response regulator
MDHKPDRSLEVALTVQEWLDSDRLRSIVSGVGSRLSVPAQDLGDVLQVVRMDLCRRGLATRLNVSYIKQVAQHRAVDLRRSKRSGGNAHAVAQSQVQNPELPSLLHARVSSLGGSMRELYRLLFEDGLTEREVAEQMKMSRGAIRRWKERLMVRLGASRRAAANFERITKP